MKVLAPKTVCDNCGKRVDAAVIVRIPLKHWSNAGVKCKNTELCPDCGYFFKGGEE